ncbi:unnamed protein product [Phytophthora lilii]|uniref:Unnamed protein product n=1 Tax=Phytophthora lilii TaxID=2077276 RepID=A0A9W7DD82_9STRA|nr:unnamed protein product [Phytophthora lilii]
MGKEDINTPEQIWQYTGSKRKRVNTSDGDIADRTKQRLEDSFLFDNSTSTTSDQTDGKITLFWIISKNKGLLESNGLRKKIIPILNGPSKSSPIDNDGYVWVDGDSTSVNGKESDRSKSAITKIGELATYAPFIYKYGQRQRSSVRNNSTNDAILKSVHDIRRQSIEEYGHDDNLQKLHDDSETAAQAYGEAQKRYEEAKEAVRGSNSKSARSALKAATAAMRATKAVLQAKAKRYSDASQVSGSGLKGRGLRGAGIAPLEGVVRRGRTYNLNEIQGLATPSAYTYKQLGSKYIRTPDLDAKTLVIVQPNRRKCGPNCQTSDNLQDIIRTPVYMNHIDQASYDKLSIDDKKLFKEILAITHLQYNFHDKLTDPLETLRAEYDKLKGEMELGNDNPSTIKQLKSLTVDMYSNRLIGDKEFKQIITRLL